MYVFIFVGLNNLVLMASRIFLSKITFIKIHTSLFDVQLDAYNKPQRSKKFGIPKVTKSLLKYSRLIERRVPTDL